MSVTVSNDNKRSDWQSLRAAPPASRRLAFGAVFGPLLFSAVWLVLGMISPGYPLFGNWISPYSPISQPISGLGLGITAPYMNAAFVLCGLMLMAGVIGIHQTFQASPRPRLRWASTALLSLAPFGMILDGIFTLEAVFPHLIGFLLATASPVFGFLAVGFLLRDLPQWQRLGRWMFLASPLTLILVILFFLTFDPVASGSGVGTAGLIQRILVIEVHAWFVALGWLAIKR